MNRRRVGFLSRSLPNLQKVLLVLLVLPALVHGQTSTTGTVVGTVIDPSGAVILDAKVELKDLATLAVLSVQTKSSGQYIFPLVTPGSYSITVTASGFKQAVVSPLAVEVAKSATVDVTLQVGDVAQKVEVTGGAQQELQTVNAAVGEVVDSESLVKLPTLTRRVIELAFLQVATMPNTGDADNSRTVAGARGDQNTYTLDGADVSDLHVGGSCCGNIGMGIMVPVEAVQEFRGGVTNQNASFGRSVGGEYAMTTRRGTNDLHGVAYWYHRNNHLNANTWERDRLGQENPVLIDNRAGFSLGGPFIKEKLFFFVNMERRRFPKKDDIVRIVPTDTLRQGLLRFRDNAGNIVGYDLASSTLCGPLNSDPCDPRGIGLSPVIAKQFALLPAGNDPSSGDGLNTIGIAGPVDGSEKSDNIVARLDYHIGKKWQLTGRWAWEEQRFNLGFYADIRGGAGNLKSAFKLPNDPYNYTFGLTGQITPSLTNEFRVAYNKSTIVFQMPDPSVLIPEAGVALNLQGINDPIDIANSRSQVGIGRTKQLIDNLTWTKGNHTVQVGANIEWLRFFHSRRGAGGLGFGGLNPSPLAEIGVHNFTVVPTTSRPPVCAATGQVNCLQSGDLSQWDALYAASLGIVDSAFHFLTRDMNTGLADTDPQVLAGGIVNEATWQHYEFYLADTWRISNSLTLSAGINLGVETPATEIKNRRAFLIDLVSGQPIHVNDYLEQRRIAATLGKGFDPGFAYSPRRFYPDVPETPTNVNPAPRVAAAWNPARAPGFLGGLLGNRKTVIRGGYGINFARVMAVGQVQTPLSGNAALAQPLVISAPRCDAKGTPGLACSPGASNDALAAFRVGPDGPVPLPVPELREPLPFAPPEPFSAVSQPQWDPAFKLGYVHAFDFTIQRELPKDFLLEAGWIGRYGRRLQIQKNINAVPFFIADLSGQSAQTFAQAFDQVATELRGGVLPANVTPQAWFENSLSPGATVNLATSHTADFITGLVQNLWFNADGIDPTLISLGRQPINNRQIRATLSTTFGGWSNYNAGFLSLNKRFSSGLSFNLNYTFSKNLETEGGITDGASGTCMNNFDYHYCYGPGLSDRTHVVNFYGVYELPFGKTRHFATGNFADKIIGGWQVSSIMQWASGLPLIVRQGDQPFGSTTSQESVPLIRDLREQGGSRHTGIPGSEGIGTAGNPTGGGTGLNLFRDPAFAYNSFRRFLISQDTGNSRGVIRGLPWFTLDMSLSKKFNVTERVGVTFGADFLNVLNHPLFSDPILDLNSPATFGVITTQPSSFAGSLGWGPRQIQLGLRIQF